MLGLLAIALGLVVLTVLSLTVLSTAGIVVGIGVLLIAFSFIDMSVRLSLGIFLVGIALVIGPFLFI